MPRGKGGMMTHSQHLHLFERVKVRFHMLPQFVLSEVAEARRSDDSPNRFERGGRYCNAAKRELFGGDKIRLLLNPVDWTKHMLLDAEEMLMILHGMQMSFIFQGRPRVGVEQGTRDAYHTL
jgi:hypothetical protein